jgi:hypothetical protein
MAETPFSAATPEGQPSERPAEQVEAPAQAPVPAQESLGATEAMAMEPVESVESAVVDEEPVVEGWSGTPDAASAPEAIARPEGTPPPEAAPAAEPGIAATLEAEPLPDAGSSAEAGEGGELDLLIAKVSAWFGDLDLPGRWQKLRGPLRGAALLLGVFLLLRLYARVVGTIDGIPVVSGLLELTGLIYGLWFSATRLVRTSERERVLGEWKRRWESFSGRS